jgi:hypothetical protein
MHGLLGSRPQIVSGFSKPNDRNRTYHMVSNVPLQYLVLLNHCDCDETHSILGQNPTPPNLAASTQQCEIRCRVEKNWKEEKRKEKREKYSNPWPMIPTISYAVVK